MKKASEFKKFEDAATKIFSVSHKELQKREEEWKKEREEKKKKRAKT